MFSVLGNANQELQRIEAASNWLALTYFELLNKDRRRCK